MKANKRDDFKARRFAFWQRFCEVRHEFVKTRR